MQDTGLAVGVGIAQTKTLAKLANHAAKTWKATGGVVDLSNVDRQRKLIALLPVDEVLGVGRRISKINCTRPLCIHIHRALKIILPCYMKALKGCSWF
ncbi:hypothetical protein [Enterobacter cloacae]|uniref:hypothetical protein n=1 Tax=Enterobacter cloacae TaxID=550 RepID=UPI003B3BDDE1